MTKQEINKQIAETIKSINFFRSAPGLSEENLQKVLNALQEILQELRKAV